MLIEYKKVSINPESVSSLRPMLAYMEDKIYNILRIYFIDGHCIDITDGNRKELHDMINKNCNKE